MSMQDELSREGYVFEYAHDKKEDHTEVWINATTNMAVRIEWIRMRDGRR